MELSFGDEGNGNKSFLPGTFLNVVRIVRAVDVSGQDIFKNNNPVNCGVELTVDIGRDFQPKFTIYGNFKEKVDKQGNSKNTWGSAFVIKDLFTTLKITGKLNKDGSIPQDILDQLVGRQILRLSYIRTYDTVADKIRYSDYKHVAVVDDFTDEAQVATAGTKLTNKFIKDVAAGWIKNFNPDAGKDKTTPF